MAAIIFQQVLINLSADVPNIMLKSHCFLIALLCESIPALENGLACCLLGSTGDSCSFKCNNGYSLIGSSQHICQPNHQWSETLARYQSKFIITNCVY